jgi:hypothetical protein
MAQRIHEQPVNEVADYQPELQVVEARRMKAGQKLTSMFRQWRERRQAQRGEPDLSLIGFGETDTSTQEAPQQLAQRVPGERDRAHNKAGEGLSPINSEQSMATVTNIATIRDRTPRDHIARRQWEQARLATVTDMQARKNYSTDPLNAPIPENRLEQATPTHDELQQFAEQPYQGKHVAGQ